MDTRAISSRLGHCELKDGKFSAEFSVEEHDASGVTETQFYLPDTFPTQESAIDNDSSWAAEDRCRFWAGINRSGTLAQNVSTDF
jgi:hypothetical protein